MNWYVENSVGLVLFGLALTLGLIVFPWTSLTHWNQKRWKNIFLLVAGLLGVGGIAVLVVQNFSQTWNVQFDPFSILVGIVTAGLTLILLYTQNDTQKRLAAIELEKHRPYLSLESKNKDIPFCLLHLYPAHAPTVAMDAMTHYWIIKHDRKEIKVGEEAQDRIIIYRQEKNVTLDQLKQNFQISDETLKTSTLVFSSIALYSGLSEFSKVYCAAYSVK